MLRAPLRIAAPPRRLLEPVAAAEGDEGDVKQAGLEVGPKHHGDHPPAATVPREPSRERTVEPNARSGIVGDGPEQVVDFVEPPFGRGQIAGGSEDMVEDAQHVAPDERMADLAQDHSTLSAARRRSAAR